MSIPKTKFYVHRTRKAEERFLWAAFSKNFGFFENSSCIFR